MGCLSSKNSHSDTNSLSGKAPESKLYSWDSRRKEQQFDKTKYIIKNVRGHQNAIFRNDVDGFPMTIDSCEDTLIFLLGVTKSIIVDDCKNVSIIAFCSDSLYVRDSSNLNLVLVTGQFRSRDCRYLKLYLHSSTKPVIETTTKVTVSPLVMDFIGIEEALKNLSFSKFNNYWSKIHDFGPVGDELNWEIYEHPNDYLASIYKTSADLFVSAPVLRAIDVSYFPIVNWSFDDKVSTTSDFVFIIFGGCNAEDLATQAYYALCYQYKKAQLIKSCSGIFMSISLPDRAKNQLPNLENEIIIALLFYGSISAVDVSDFATPGESYASFQMEAKLDAENLFTSRNLMMD